MDTTYSPLPGRARPGRILLAIAGLAAAALLASGCDTAEQVPWGSYSSGLQQQIDDATATGNCAALAGYLAAAQATNSVHVRATGIPNDALYSYIRDAQQQAGCPSETG